MPTAKVAPEACVPVKEATPQLSVAVGSVHVATAPQMPASLLRLKLAGMPAMTGNSSSVTVISMVAELLFPLPSFAVKVTVVVPTGNASSGSWEVVNVPLPQLSATVGFVQVTTAVHNPASVVVVMSLGTLDNSGSS